MKNILISIVVALLLAGCVGLPAPAATPTDTPLPLPTLTPAPTLSPTALFELQISTATLQAAGTAPSAETLAATFLSCRVISQGVRNGTKFDPKETFDMGWNVRNNGEAVWDPGLIEFTYYSGSKLHVSAVSQLATAVGPGETTLLVADMVAPRGSGSYTTVWTLRRGDEDFCHVNLTITVR